MLFSLSRQRFGRYTLRSLLFPILSPILNWLRNCIVENLRWPNVLKLFLASKLKVLLAFFDLSISFTHFFIVLTEVFAASTFLLQHFFLWIEFGAAVLKSLCDLVKYFCRLVLKLSLLKEAHQFFFCFGNLNLKLLICIRGQLNPVLLENINNLLELSLALVNLLRSM